MLKNEIFALKGIKGVGSVAIYKIINYLNALGKKTLFDVNLTALINHPSFSRYKKVLETNLNEDFLKIAIERATEEIDSFEKKGIRVIAITSALYPESLKLTKSAPELLFCKGNIDLLSQNKNIAVVGTRKNTFLGKAIATKTTRFLVSSGYVVVSGLALGIDAIAHEECLNCEGKTIAVLVDVNNVQPIKNRDLADRILKNGGLLISENAPGISITPPLFVKRDRIQTGISLAVFPIETSINGGTMHAVKAAKQENRLIYVPDHTKSGYQDKEIEQIAGIISLSFDTDVEPYTKYSYPNIIDRLHQKENELFPMDKVQGTLL